MLSQPDKNEIDSLRELTLENQRLLTENNQLLKQMKRYSVWSFWFKIVWSLIIVGLPFVLYFYVIQPYFETMGSSFETFKAGIEEIPGWKQFYQSLHGGGK